MYHASLTHNAEPETNFEALDVKGDNPFHESDFVIVNVNSQSMKP